MQSSMSTVPRACRPNSAQAGSCDSNARRCKRGNKLSEYLFKHYLPRKSPESFTCMNHSLDFKPLDPVPPKSRKSMIDFSKQLKSIDHFHGRPATSPDVKAVELIRRHVSTTDFSRQITREQANFRTRRLSFDIEDRSYARDCNLTLPRKRFTIFYPAQLKS